MSVLIIAEKPELGRSIANVLMPGVKEINGVIKNDKYAVVWAFGHLLQLKEPVDYDDKYKDRFDTSVLPIGFKNWKKIPAKDIVDSKTGNIKLNNAYKRTRIKQIGELLSCYDTVINAGDPDDEGQLLIDELLDYFHFNGKVQRVLINDNMPENIRKAFSNLEDNSKYRSTGNSAYARQMADMAFGLSHSRLATARLKSYLTVGRVQTPTLYMVVRRDNEIDSHKTRKYYELSAETTIDKNNCLFKFKPSKDILDGEKHIFDRTVIEQVASNLQKGKSVNVEVKNEIKYIHPPLPYNATELQAHMNELYGYSLKKTMEITQVLRDKYKAITYNRSDCQYLKVEHYEEANKVIPVVLKNLSVDYPVDYSIKSECFDDSKVSAHHAVIPQNNSLSMDSFKDEKSVKAEELKNVYIAICLRYIMQFLPPVKSELCKASYIVDGYKFVYSASRVLDNGYKQYFKSDEKVENNLFIDQGNYAGLIVDREILEKETKPAQRYTPKTLVKDMCSISKYVTDPDVKKALKMKDHGKEGENGSIGTVATRAAIVDNLISVGYLEMKGKNIVSTEKGKAFCKLIPDSIKGPDMTARWWLIQEKIKEGSEDVNKIMEDVLKDFNQHKDSYYSDINSDFEKAASSDKKIQIVGDCPWCNQPMIRRLGKNGVYYIHSKETSCNFALNENILIYGKKKKLSVDAVKTLLAGKKVEVKGLHSEKKNMDYDVQLELLKTPKEYNGKHYPDFKITFNTEHEKLGNCPWCGKPIISKKFKTGKVFTHDNQSNCEFALFENTKLLFEDITLTDSKVKKLLSKSGMPMYFTARDSGNRYQANVVIDKEPSVYKNKKYPKFVKITKNRK